MTTIRTDPVAPTGTRALLKCGIVAAPLFSGLVLLQAAIRPGFHLTTMPLSLLSLGTLGWVQVVNFIVSGALVLACAAGVRLALASRTGTLISLLLLLYGAGMAAAGIFPSDPIDGFPIGSAATAAMSWHANLHGLAFALAQLGAMLACATFGFWFAARGLTGWAVLSTATAIITPALIVLGFRNASVMGLAFFLTGIVTMGWLALVSALLDSRSDSPGQTILRRAT
jgi:hypothetical protein